MSTESDWLTWARELQALPQTGLSFARNPYDRDRYEKLRTLSARMMAAYTAAPSERIEALFAGETGYATPKIDMRGAVFDNQWRLLLVRERADADRWTLPGGWADVNPTAAENVIKEVGEQSGLLVRVTKLAAVWDRIRQGHTEVAGFVYEVAGGEMGPDFGTWGVIGKAAVPLLNGAEDDEANETDD